MPFEGPLEVVNVTVWLTSSYRAIVPAFWHTQSIYEHFWGLELGEQQSPSKDESAGV